MISIILSFHLLELILHPKLQIIRFLDGLDLLCSYTKQKV